MVESVFLRLHWMTVDYWRWIHYENEARHQEEEKVILPKYTEVVYPPVVLDDDEVVVVVAIRLRLFLSVQYVDGNLLPRLREVDEHKLRRRRPDDFRPFQFAGVIPLLREKKIDDHCRQEDYLEDLEEAARRGKQVLLVLLAERKGCVSDDFYR